MESADKNARVTSFAKPWAKTVQRQRWSEAILTALRNITRAEQFNAT